MSWLRWLVRTIGADPQASSMDLAEDGPRSAGTLLDDQTLGALRGSEWLAAAKDLARRLELRPAEEQTQVLIVLADCIPAVAPHVWKRLRTRPVVHRNVFVHVLRHTRVSGDLSQLMLVARHQLGPRRFVRMTREALAADPSPGMQKSVGYFLGWVAAKDPEVQREVERQRG